MRSVEHHKIIHVYGVSDTLVKPLIISYLENRKAKKGVKVIARNSLSDVIVTLNDSAHYTFSEIAYFIRELNYNGYLKKCTKLQQITAEKLMRIVPEPLVAGIATS